MKLMFNQIEYWDRVAYEKKFNHPIRFDKFKQCVKYNANILDFGCGYGRTLNELRTNGYTNLIGIDSSMEMISRGKSL